MATGQNWWPCRDGTQPASARPLLRAFRPSTWPDDAALVADDTEGGPMARENPQKPPPACFYNGPGAGMKAKGNPAGRDPHLPPVWPPQRSKRHRRKNIMQSDSIMKHEGIAGVMAAGAAPAVHA